jgi:penicillin G amidase
MKILKRGLLILAILIALVVIAGLVLLDRVKKGSIPDYNKNQEISGLTEEVTIFRDEYGVPHIYAKNESDLYLATGYVMAQDRLWQMDLLRRVTQGRLSEILGKSQVNTDLLMRALRISEKSEKIFEKASPEIVGALKSFAEGMNLYMKSHPLPPEFKVLGYRPENWEPLHSINLIGYMAWDLSSGWGAEMTLRRVAKEVSKEQIADLIPRLANHKTPVFTDFKSPLMKEGENLLSSSYELEKLGLEIFSGSNNWAVSGKKSKTGKPLMANDMHLGLNAPGIWYQMHQSVEGKLNVTGVAVPGQPFVVAGHNDSIAWGMTNVMVDDLDFYAETLNADSTKYLLNGEWKALEIRNEVIKTKEGEDFVIPLRFTHRGPIVNRFKQEKETPLSIHWLGNEMSNEVQSICLLNRARNWNDFRDAVRTFVSVSQNIVYADAAGNIGLQTSAGIPVREGNGIDIYPGDTTRYDWKGIVPFEELPYEYNPPRGYVSSANNKTVPDDYPYYISNWFATSSRIDRIREMLEEKELFGIGDFQQMQSDFKAKTAVKFVPLFLDALVHAGNWNETEAAALVKLEKWDFKLTKESQAASIFEILYRKTMENLIVDDVDSVLFKSFKNERVLIENLLINIADEKTSEWIDDKRTPQKEIFNDIVIRSFRETVTDLTARLGKDAEKWQWGKIHSFTLSHPLGSLKILDKLLNLNRGPFEMPGSFHTVCPYSYSYGNLYKTNHGASHRHIFDTSDWDASKTVIPTGESGIPASKFYLNQTELYISNTYHPDPFSRKEVEKAAKFRMKLLKPGI